MKAKEKKTSGTKQTELQGNDLFLGALAEHSLAGIYLVQDGKFCFLNANVASYSKYERSELIGKKADSLIHPDDRERVKVDARAMLRRKRFSPYVFRVITKDGQIRWVMETVIPFTFNGKPALLGNSMDITNRMEAEKRLQESENLYRTIFETTGTATIILEEDTTVSLVNTEFEKISGAPKEYWEGRRRWTEFVHEKDREKMLGYHYSRRVDPESAPRNYEFSFVDTQGNVKESIITIAMIPGTKKSVASFADISERRKAEEQLRKSEDLYRTIFETTGMATVILEEDTTVSLVNTEFEKLSGAPKEYWEGKRSWTEFVQETDRPRMLGYHYSRRVDPESAPRNYEFSFVDTQGNVKEVFITIAMIPGTKKSVASFADISERRKAEEQLRKSEDLYRTIFETTGTATIILEEDTTVSLVNTEFEKISGAPKEYWEGRRRWTEFVHEKDREKMLGYHYSRRVDPDSAPRNYEFSFVDTQGNVKESIITIAMIPGTKKSVASFADISERRKAEEQLRKSEDLYRTIFETTGMATVILEEDTTVSLVNTEFEQLSGAPKEYWEGKRSWKEFVHEKDQERMVGYHQSRRVDPDSAPRNYEFSFVDQGGNVKEVFITIAMIPGTKKSVASLVDITERKFAENALKKRERELKDKTDELEELNAALRVLLKRREEDKLELENNVISNLNKLVIPYLEKLRKSHFKGSDLICLNVIESNLKDIAMPFVNKLSSEYLRLTPKELQVAHLIKEGKTTKEIAEFMNASPATVEIHRYHIREKLGLTKKKTNLRTYLSSLK